MFGSDTLEVIAGIAFVFILVSTICSAVREGIEAWLKTRASYLEYGIRELLQDRQGTGLARHLFQHPLVFGLFQGNYTPGAAKDKDKHPSMWTSGNNLPSYIPATNFALALMDIAARGPTDPGATQQPGTAPMSLALIRQGIAKIGNPPVQRALLAAIDSANGNFDRARTNIENWYDSTMDRVSGWYKRSTQWILFWIALVLAAALNVNTITIADYLYRHTAERQAVVSMIQKTPQTNPNYTEAKTQLDNLGLPIGWAQGWGSPKTCSQRSTDGGKTCVRTLWQDGIAPFLGWLLTAFAASLGAPFWFDILNQVMVIRSTVKPRQKSGEEASMDPQPRPPPAPSVVVEAGQPPSPDSSGDSCGVGPIMGTPDEALPAARGGVE